MVFSNLAFDILITAALEFLGVYHNLSIFGRRLLMLR